MRVGILVVSVVAVLAAPSARGSVIDNDGSTDTVNGPSAGISVFNGTTLNVVDGASILGSDATYAGVFAFGPGTSVNVSGGSITGGVPSTPGLPAGPAVNAFGGAALTVSGGTLTGGGSAQALLATDAGPVTITGGTFNNDGSVGATSAFLQTSLFPITILGGLFNNSATVGVSSGATASISGGTFNSPLNPLLLLGDSGGSVTISGGAFNTPIELNLQNDATVSVFGSGLSYNNGLLMGVLTDGETVSTSILADQPLQVTVDGTNEITFQGDPLPAVPEPASLGLFATGLLAVAGASRARRLRR